MKILKSLFKITILLIILVNLGCSKHGTYKLARKYYLADKLVIAIEYYDRFIERTSDGALATKSELERSECYYQLGLQIFAKENWKLAINLFYLANSLKADEKIDNCYYELSQIASMEKDTTQVLKYYDHITTYLKTSELIPEILYNRIQINVERDNKHNAFEDYHKLWKEYPDDDYTRKVQPFIDMMMPYYIEEVIALQDSGKYETSLTILKNISQYPSSYWELIIEEISDIYVIMADLAFEVEDFDTAKEHLLLSIEYNSDKEAYMHQKLIDVCENYLSQGDVLLSDRKIEEALELYEKTKRVIPDYENTKISIEAALQLKKDFEKAEELRLSAVELENDEKFAEALKLYKQSYALKTTDEIQNKIFRMNNLIEAKKDPIAFALSIIQNYKAGAVAIKMQEIENRMIELYGDNVRISGWKVLYSFGEYKYELRYDIVGAEESYYFVWRVNLGNRDVKPLNKISEEILEITFNEEEEVE